MEFFHGTNIDFLGKRKIFFIMSLILCTVGILIAVIFPPQLGIDFTGGTEVGVSFNRTVSTEDIRVAIDKTELRGGEIKSFGNDNQYLIRVREAGDAPAQITGALSDAFPDANPTIIKVDRVGPKIGAELTRQAIMAVIFSVLAILIYIAFRFEFIFGLGAIVALIHDVIFAFAAVVVAQKLGMNITLDQSIMAAMLTVIGFSINDTVIIFDRIRENKELHKGMNLMQIMNLSINETLSRTINTVLTVVLVLFTMVLLGGEVLRGFSFTMLIGIITGAYSSIYIASAFVIWYMQSVKKVPVESEAERKQAASKVRPVKA